MSQPERSAYKPAWLSRVVMPLGVLAALLVINVALLMWAPWRNAGPIDEHGDRVTYIERVVGRGAGVVDPETPLPMIVDVHGYSAFPEVHGHIWNALQVPVRLVVPAGPDRALIGRSWFPLDSEALGESIPRSTDRLAALIQDLRATRPTIGRSLVTGFSQGGVLSFALAARYPSSIAAAFPVAGWLPTELVPSGSQLKARPIVIAFHDAEDGPEWCLEAVDALRNRGWAAQAHVFPGVGHSLPNEMKAQLIDEVQSVLATRSRNIEVFGDRKQLQVDRPAAGR